MYGSKIVTSGNSIVTHGSPFATNGKTILTHGNLIVMCGNKIITTGNSISTNGRKFATSGRKIYEKSTSYNIGLAIWRLKCFYETFVQGSTAVVLLNFCAKNPPHRQAVSR